MDTQNLFVKGLENIFQNSNNNVNDKTYVGVIIDIIDTKKYIIRYNDADRPFTTKYNDSLKVGDAVHVMLPLGSEANKFLLEDIRKY